MFVRREEQRAGDADGGAGGVRGSYSVVLPDGRTQTVTYEDTGSGISMLVSYD